MDFRIVFFLMAGLICAVCILASRNQIRATLVLIAVLYVFPAGWVFYNYTGVLLVDVAILAALMLGLASGQKIRFFFKEISIPIFILLGWMFVTSSRAMEPGWGYAEISKWVRGYLIFVCLANFIKTEQDLRTVLYAVLAGFVFEAVLGVYQWRRGSLGLWFLGERLYRPEWWRAYGTFYVPSHFGNHLMMMLPILLRLFIFYKPPQKKETYFYGFALLCGFLALYATYARGPWISFATVVVLMLLFTFFKSKLRPKIKWPIAAGIILGLAFSLKYTDKVIEQFGEQRKTSAMSRIYLGEVAWRLIQDNLAFGVGPGNYEINSPRYVVPIKEYPTEHLSEIVHNTYLLIFSENGVLGIAAFALILIQMCVLCLRMFRSNHGIGLNLAIGGAMAILALAISFIASPDIHNEQTLNQMFLTVGMVFACELMERRHAAVQRQLQVQQRREIMQARQEKLASAGVHPVENGQTVSNGATSPRPAIGASDTMRDSWPPRRRS
ncbi:MAG: O-antigen ligase family protein [bacterium]